MKMPRALFGLLLVACSHDETLPHEPAADAGEASEGGAAADPTRLTVDGRFFRDGLGRAVILRGVNARVEGVFDVSFADGRTAVEDIPSLGADDCKRMAELGFTLLRLPIHWSAIEPARDHFDEAYLKRVDDVVACMAQQGIYTLVDLHQDAYSKEIGEDGAPLWAIVPAPSRRLEGPLTEGELSRRRFSAQVLDAFSSFFAAGDPHGLVAEYIAMLEHVAAHFASEPHVLGLDLFNEPVTSGSAVRSFMARAGQAVHGAAPDLTVVFEPTTFWSLNGGERVMGGAYAVERAVYAPHLYELSITGDTSKLETVTREDLLPAFETAAREASAYQSAWLIGEFGAGPLTTNYEQYLDVFYDLQDEFLVSSALWLWKESSQGSWGLFDFAGGAFSERPAMVEQTSRPHAQRIAGTPTRMAFDGESLRFSYEAALAVPNVIYVPERFAIVDASCDGKALALDTAGSRVELSCATGASHDVVVKLERVLPASR
jgi:endoglycosylceramidase